MHILGNAKHWLTCYWNDKEEAAPMIDYWPKTLTPLEMEQAKETESHNTGYNPDGRKYVAFIRSTTTEATYIWKGETWTRK